MSFLISAFVVNTGYHFLKKIINSDDDKLDDVPFEKALGGFIGGLAYNVLGNLISKYPDKGLDKITQRIREKRLPINHDIQKAVDKAFYYAFRQMAKSCHSLTTAKEDKKTIEWLIDKAEKDKSVQTKVNVQYLNLADIGIESNKESQKELEKTLNEYIKQKIREWNPTPNNYTSSIPENLANAIENGFHVGEQHFTFFQFMCDYFHELLKSPDGRLREIIQSQWLATILGDITEIKEKVNKIELDIEKLTTLTNNAILAVGILPQFIEDQNQLFIDEIRKGNKLVEKYLNPQPYLVSQFNSNGQTRAHFKSEYTDFAGRESEMDMLLDFVLADPQHKFSWWVVSGAAGSGKSRTALELCNRLSLLSNVYCGFLDYASFKKVSWEVWEPVTVTLIIVDYASSQHEDLYKCFEILHNRINNLNYPVRFLLLERETSGTWWDKMKNCDFGPFIQNAERKPPLQLYDLGDDILFSLITEVINKEYQNTSTLKKKELPDKTQTLEDLKRIDPKGRPLFAVFAAFALAYGENIRDWNQEKLLEKELLRQETYIWEPHFENKKEKLKLYKNWLTVTTLCGGMDSEMRDTLRNKQVSPQKFHYLPEPGELTPESYRIFSSAAEKDGVFWFAPMEPDILGEFFVIQNLTALKKNGEDLMNLAQYAWNTNPLGTTLFISNCFQDFSKEPIIESLILIPLGENYLTDICWSILIPYVVSQYGESSQFDKTKHLYINLKQVANRYPEEKIIQSSVANAAFNLINGLSASDMKEALTIFNELKVWALQFPAVVEIQVVVAKAAFNLITDLRASDMKEALTIFNELKVWALQFLAVVEIQIEVANAAFNLITDLRASDMKEALTIFNELKVWALQFPAVVEIQIEVANAAFNLINGLSASDMKEALTIFNELKVWALQFPAVVEIQVVVANAAFNLITNLSASDMKEALTIFNELKVWALQFPAVVEIQVVVANAAFNLITDLSAPDMKEALTIFNELKVWALQFPAVVEIQIEVANAAFNLINGLSASDMKEALTIFNELKVWALQFPAVVEIQVVVAKAAFNLINGLSASDMKEALTIFNELKVWALQFPAVVEIQVVVANEAFNLITDLRASDMKEALTIFNELKVWALQFPAVVEIQIEVANAAFNLINGLSASDMKEALTIFNELKVWALQFPAVVEIQVEVAKAVATIINHYLKSEVKKALTIFAEELFPIGEATNHPFCWLIIEISTANILRIHYMNNKEELTPLANLFLGLLQTYYEKEEWQHYVPEFISLAKQLELTE